MALDLMQPNSEPKHRNYIIPIVAILVLVSMIMCGLFLFKGLGDYNELIQMQLTWTEIQKIADTPPEDPQDIITEVIDEEGNVLEIVSGDPDDLYRSINLTDLYEVNPDLSGYIYIPGTEVDYPILKETVPGDYYYLDHNIYNKTDKYGSIFEISDEERGIPGIDNAVNVIFGHHMASGAMFSGIYGFYNEETREEYKDKPIYIYRRDVRTEYRVSAVCIVKNNDIVYDFDAYARGSENYEILSEHIKEKQVDGITFNQSLPTKDEDMVVLSTCYGDAGTSWRLIVVCTEYRKVTVPNTYNSYGDTSIATEDIALNATPEEER